jgi:diaminohydroxyphosphoribosylaminopyrimidine deaminase/5-amino-6-(5-phosphoribosylamino)uracil reductase
MIIHPNHEAFMQRCFELAKNGQGYVAPNPLVGSVIVYNNKIIGEGYHHKYGAAHAEVNAINSVTDKNLLSQSTLYVNLEPCSHYGKTPPCSDLIIQKGIPKVVIANVDPYEKVKGKGIERMRNSGIEVTTGILDKQGEDLNKRFFTFHSEQRPYIILKWAQTSDGFIDIIRHSEMPTQPNWITNEHARIMVHKWRAEEQAIMVGTNTAFIDNPKLNVRNWHGKNPVRVLIDKDLRLPLNLNIFDGSIPTLVFSEKKPEKEINGVEFILLNFNVNIVTQICNELYKRNIISIIIEGGAKLLNTFIYEGFWDEARVFTGNIKFLKGINAPAIKNKPVFTETWKEFRLDIYRQ